LYVTGRRKELIVIHGRNYYPQDIEEAARRSDPALCDGAGSAFSIETTAGEEAVLVFELTRRALQNIATRQVTAAVMSEIFRDLGLRLHDVVLVQPGGIPRTTSGKIQRVGTREKYLTGNLPVIASSIEYSRPDHAGAEPRADSRASAR
jgi:acyl-CoA synthetase (AMP-forming)/AMP-acid ligase II